MLYSSMSSMVIDDVVYDEAGRLTRYRMPRGGPLWRHQTYYRLGNIKSYLDSLNNVFFDYDGQNRLTAGYKPTGANSDPKFQYAYDAAGRLTSIEGISLTLTSGLPAHATYPLTSTAAYQYDLNGNVKVRSIAPGQTQTLQWDAENRLSSVISGTLSESYLYDPDGQRVKKTSNGVEFFYISPNFEVSRTVVARSTYPTETEQIWFNDAYPGTVMTQTTTVTTGLWKATNPSPFSGSQSLSSPLTTGEQTFWFNGYSITDVITHSDFTVLSVLPGDYLYFHLRRDSTNPPNGVKSGWTYEDFIPDAITGVWWPEFGTIAHGGGDPVWLGEMSTYPTSFTLPAPGVWGRIEVTPSLLGLTNKMLYGMHIHLQNGRANIDKVGKIHSLPPPPPGTGPVPVEGITKYYTFNGQRVAVRNNHTIGGDSFASVSVTIRL